MPEPKVTSLPTRRTILEAGSAAAALLLSGIPAGAQTPAPVAPSTDARVQAVKLPLELTINAKKVAVELDPRTTLLDALRDQLGLTGSKKGCDHGQCGACTVLVNGRRINSCLTLAVMHEGDEITTIEGTGRWRERCIRCRPPSSRATASSAATARPARSARPSACWARSRPAGRAMSPAISPPPASTLTDAEIRERMSGNICRCAAYPNIVAAIRDVAEKA